jgi:glycosyltransferase involved in cell wall biosynthesis
MRNLVARCGTQSVTVLPKVVDVRRLLKACDVFVSLSFAEGLPNAVLEAAASNVLVLARKLPGVFDGFLDQSNAILFDHFDSGVLLQLREFVTDGRHLHIDNSRYASTFDLEVIARAYRDLYAALMR